MDDHRRDQALIALLLRRRKTATPIIAAAPTPAPINKTKVSGNPLDAIVTGTVVEWVKVPLVTVTVTV